MFVLKVMIRSSGKEDAILDHGIGRRLSTLRAALYEALKINEDGEQVALEIKGDDGTHLDRRQIEEVIFRQKADLIANPPEGY